MKKNKKINSNLNIYIQKQNKIQMSREASPCSITYELNKSCNYGSNICEHDTISQLKVQVFEKDQNKKNMQNLLSMYHNLQEQTAKISQQKNCLEITLKQIDSDDRNKAIFDLKNKNDILFNELNEKIAMNKNLYNENNNLFHELESKTAESQNLQNKIQSQQILVNRLKSDKEQLQNKVFNLSQGKEKQEKDIQGLSIQVDKINLENNSQENFLKAQNQKNCELVNTLNEEKNINNNLIVELRNKENNIILSQQKLNKDNDTIKLLQSDIINMTNTNKKVNEEICLAKDNLFKESSILSQVNADNQHFESLIKDRDAHINQINNDNNLLKQGNATLNCDNEKLNNLINAYKKHLLLLVSQNKKLAVEIQTLIGRDSELKVILERDNHLSDIRFENDQLVKNSTEKIAQVMNAEPILDNSMVIPTRKRTYSFNSNENGNSGRNSIDNIINSPNNYDRSNNMDNGEINPTMSGIINQGNDLQISQELYNE